MSGQAVARGFIPDAAARRLVTFVLILLLLFLIFLWTRSDAVLPHAVLLYYSFVFLQAGAD